MNQAVLNRSVRPRRSTIVCFDVRGLFIGAPPMSFLASRHRCSAAIRSIKVDGVPIEMPEVFEIAQGGSRSAYARRMGRSPMLDLRARDWR